MARKQEVLKELSKNYDIVKGNGNSYRCENKNSHFTDGYIDIDIYGVKAWHSSGEEGISCSDSIAKETLFLVTELVQILCKEIEYVNNKL